MLMKNDPKKTTPPLSNTLSSSIKTGSPQKTEHTTAQKSGNQKTAAKNAAKVNPPKTPALSAGGYTLGPFDGPLLAQLKEVQTKNPEKLPQEWIHFLAKNTDDIPFHQEPSWLSYGQTKGHKTPTPFLSGTSTRLAHSHKPLSSTHKTRPHSPASEPPGLKPPIPESPVPPSPRPQQPSYENKTAPHSSLTTHPADLERLNTGLWHTCGLALTFPAPLTPDKEHFWRQQCESIGNLESSERSALLSELVATQAFEHFIGRKFPGLKRFSVEGVDALIPGLSYLANCATQQGHSQMVLGMAHRGRLATRVRFCEEPLLNLFSLFNLSADAPPPSFSDVPYHLGAFAKKITPHGPLEVTLLPNPSHLESINPVMLGYTRALIDYRRFEASRAKKHKGHTFNKVNAQASHSLSHSSPALKPLSVLIHGDAAFAGQGVVTESLLLGTLKNYEVGGTIHVLLNNQVGFTATPMEAYGGNPLRPALMMGMPIIHINGNNPEAMCGAFRWALLWRTHFGADIALHLIGYRRYGHNELDEPRFTNPRLYASIDAKAPLWKTYAAQLNDEGLNSLEIALDVEQKTTFELEEAFGRAAQAKTSPQISFPEKTTQEAPTLHPKITGLQAVRLQELQKHLTLQPEGITLHPKILSFLEKRHEMLEKGAAIDWSTAEALALASLIADGVSIRFSGQDVIRGTFSQRHATFFDQAAFKTQAYPWLDLKDTTLPFMENTPDADADRAEDRERADDAKYAQLNHAYSPFIALAKDTTCVDFINSPLSEAGTLGFEIGYSWATTEALRKAMSDTAHKKRTLVLWEAQFGDFINGAQIQIDQYLAASKTKWNVTSNLVVLLPHGYEGQGPEHSSARLERFLQLSAQNNMHIAMPASPAAFFHMLRAQGLNPFAPPLIVFTPKSLLRHPKARDPLEAFQTPHTLNPVIVSPHAENKASAPKTRLLLCTGKIYYDLLDALTKAPQGTSEKIALVRFEVLAPFPEVAFLEALEKIGKQEAEVTWMWVQEEPQNMGAFRALEPLLSTHARQRGVNIHYVGRERAASPATGFYGCHQRETALIIQEALNGV